MFTWDKVVISFVLLLKKIKKDKSENNVNRVDNKYITYSYFRYIVCVHVLMHDIFHDVIEHGVRKCIISRESVFDALVF